MQQGNAKCKRIYISKELWWFSFCYFYYVFISQCRFLYYVRYISILFMILLLKRYAIFKFSLVSFPHIVCQSFHPTGEAIRVSHQFAISISLFWGPAVVNVDILVPSVLHTSWHHRISHLFDEFLTVNKTNC